MKGFTTSLAITLLVVALGALPGFADSSGNFTVTGVNAACIATPACFFPATCVTGNGSVNSCPTDFTCTSGACVPASGTSCSSSQPCACGLACVSGVCAEQACSSQIPCPFGFTCSSDTTTLGSCSPPVGGFGGNTLSGGTTTTTFIANIQTPGAQGATLLIRPSLDTGLFTATKLSSTINNATADVGIMVCVQVDGGATQVFPQTNLNITGGAAPGSSCVVYDQRIQQVSNTLFQLATACAPVATSTMCTTDADCSSLGTGAFCSGGFCFTVPSTAAAAGCNFETLETTLAAHSFDFVAPITKNGSHPVSMTWGLIGTGNTTVGGSFAACVGPAEVTVQQVKNFSNDSTITFQ